MSDTENMADGPRPLVKNVVTCGLLLTSMDDLRQLSLMKPAGDISVSVFLAFDDLQSIMDAVTKAFNAADDKAMILATEVELPFMPFPIEKFFGGELSTAAFTKLKGWFLTRGPSKVKLPDFPAPNGTAH